MPVFYFDFTDDDYAARDEEGCVLPSPEAARTEALKAVVEVYAFEPRDVDRRCICCSVRDERSAVVFRASLTLQAERNPRG